MELKERYTKVWSEVENVVGAEGAKKICLIAVSKKQPVEKIEALYRLGHRDFGENYVQELLEKAKVLEEKGLNEIRWHFIGRLQRNKVAALLPHVSVIHTVDSERLAVEISKRAERSFPVFIQVNIDLEERKSGVNPKNVLPLVECVSKKENLSVQGLMCIPRAALLPDADPVQSFRNLKALGETVSSFTESKLSMGMSSDFKEALKEGATHIRLGTCLFGPRGE